MRRPVPTIASAAVLAALTLAGVGLAGCGSSGSTSAAPAAPASSAEAVTYPVTQDGTTLSAKPTHIISMSPTATDMLFTIGAGSQVIAVDKNSDYFGANPPATTPPADIDAFQPNAETIAAKSPDLVVLSDDTNKIKEALVKLKIPVYMAPAATTIDDTYHQMTALGALTGHPTTAAAAVAAEKKAISDDLAKLKPRTQAADVLLRAGPDVLLGHLEDVHRLAVRHGEDDEHCRRREREQSVPAAVGRGHHQGEPGRDLPRRHGLLPAVGGHGGQAARLVDHRRGQGPAGRADPGRRRVAMGLARAEAPRHHRHRVQRSADVVIRRS